MKVKVELTLYPDETGGAPRWNEGKPVYEAGDSVAGKIIVDVFSKQSNIRAIRVKLIGKADVKWEEGTSESGTVHQDEETYLNQKITLFGSETTDDNFEKKELDVGKYAYKFSYNLPFHLPPTFTGSAGNVHYFCEGYVDIPYAPDPSHVVAFTVRNKSTDKLELSNTPQIMNPVREEHEKLFGCSCFDQSPVVVSMTIPRRGWITEEIINVQLDIDNRSSSPITKCVTWVDQVLTYHATSCSKSEDINIATVTSKQSLPEGRQQGVHEATLSLPADLRPSSFLNLCKLIDVKYVIRAIVKPKNAFFGKGVFLEIPITIGSSKEEQEHQT